jgi:hypothetical protein
VAYRGRGQPPPPKKKNSEVLTKLHSFSNWAEPLTLGLPPLDPRSLCPLSSTEFFEPPPHPEKIPGYATGEGKYCYFHIFYNAHQLVSTITNLTALRCDGYTGFELMVVYVYTCDFYTCCIKTYVLEERKLIEKTKIMAFIFQLCCKYVTVRTLA